MTLEGANEKLEEHITTYIYRLVVRRGWRIWVKIISVEVPILTMSWKLNMTNIASDVKRYIHKLYKSYKKNDIWPYIRFCEDDLSVSK